MKPSSEPPRSTLMATLKLHRLELSISIIALAPARPLGVSQPRACQSALSALAGCDLVGQLLQAGHDTAVVDAGLGVAEQFEGGQVHIHRLAAPQAPGPQAIGELAQAKGGGAEILQAEHACDGIDLVRAVVDLALDLVGRVVAAHGRQLVELAGLVVHVDQAGVANLGQVLFGLLQRVGHFHAARCADHLGQRVLPLDEGRCRHYANLEARFWESPAAGSSAMEAWSSRRRPESPSGGPRFWKRRSGPA